MDTVLLCVDLFEDYSLIDRALLLSSGVKPFYVYTPPEKQDICADYTIVDDFNFSELLKAAKEVKADKIICFSEELFMIVAMVREELGVNGMSVETAKLFSNKKEVYDRLSEKVETPKTIQIINTQSFQELQNDLQCESLFIKPKSCSGSFETYTVTEEGEYQGFLQNKKLESCEYIAQEFIEGDLYHVELVLEKGSGVYESARKYSAPNNTMLLSDKILFSAPVDDSDVETSLINEARNVCCQLGIKNSIVHIEFFREKNTGRLLFLETNLRAPGIGLNKMYKEKLGISFETMLCFLVCNFPIPKFIVDNKYYLCGYYPIREGKIKKINCFEHSVKSRWTFFVKEGDERESAETMSKAAMVICSDASLEKIKHAGKGLLNHCLLEMY